MLSAKHALSSLGKSEMLFLARHSGCKLHVSGVLYQVYYLFQLLHLLLHPPCFFWGITTTIIQILTALFQVKDMGSGGQANIAWLGGTGLKKKNQPLFLLVYRERSHLVQQCVTHLGSCEKPVMDCRSISFCPLWHFTYCMLLSGTTHCPMRVYPYCTIIWLEYMAVFMTSSTWVHKLCRTSSLVLKCMCTVCVWVCVWQRGSGALQYDAKGGRQRKTRPQRGWKWE